jgi:hypothetical protein
MDNKIINFFWKIIWALCKTIIVWVIIIRIIIYLLWYFFPYQEIENYDKDKTIELLNQSIKLSHSDVNKVIFSQSMYLTFLWDGWYDLVVELTDDAKSKIIKSKNTKLWTLELKNISRLLKCSFTDYNNRELEIVDRWIYEENNFYYISKDHELGWGIYLYISEKNNNLYFCNYRT